MTLADIPIKATFVKITLILLGVYYAAQLQIEWRLIAAAERADATARTDLALAIGLYGLSLLTIAFLSVTATLFTIAALGFVCTVMLAFVFNYLDN